MASALEGLPDPDIRASRRARVTIACPDAERTAFYTKISTKAPSGLALK
jgi:hypothetical protein